MTYKKTNLWILSEERPKEEIVQYIIERLSYDKKLSFFIPNFAIVPVMYNQKFTFTYQVIGIFSPQINDIFIKLVSGKSSFVDYLVFLQDNPPSSQDIPLYAIEETKTTSKDSRNTSVFQRISKFVYLDIIYPNEKVKKIMLYNYERPDKREKAKTFYFGLRLLKTLGVNIEFLNTSNQFKEEIDKIEAFKNIGELIVEKESLSKSGPSHNTPLLLERHENKILIRAKLDKGNQAKFKGKLSHDPNIGAVSALAAVLRKLGWNKEIIVTDHGIESISPKAKNKFIKIANSLNIKLDNLSIPKTKSDPVYWEYDLKSEKNVTILTHITTEKFSDQSGQIIFENHASSSLGFFITNDGRKISIDKNVPKPDLVIKDRKRKEILDIEGEKIQNIRTGIQQIDDFKKFEEQYIKKYYPNYRIVQSLILYDDNWYKTIKNKQLLLLYKQIKILNIVNKKENICANKDNKLITLTHLILSRKEKEYAEIIVNEKFCPQLIKESFENLFKFWQNTLSN